MTDHRYHTAHRYQVRLKIGSAAPVNFGAPSWTAEEARRLASRVARGAENSATGLVEVVRSDGVRLGYFLCVDPEEWCAEWYEATDGTLIKAVRS